MSNGQKLRCSWHLVAVVTVFVVVISVVHVYFVPIIPSSVYLFGEQQTQKARVPNKYTPTNSHGGVVYRKATWHADVGSWLSRCHDIAEPVPINEIIRGKNCKNSCSGHGICNRELGECRCFHGFGGEGCSEKLNFACNLPSSPEAPYGPWLVSICSAHCDTTRAMCFCGESFKYPDRPVAEACGFEVNGQVVDWTRPDFENIFTNNSSKHGWCNVDPQAAYEGKVQYKVECDCKYDGRWGRFCEIPTECSCINQCSGNGYCHGGFCQIALYESLLASPHRTLNGEEADYFYVPVLDACLITRADDAPHLNSWSHMGLRSYLTLDLYKQAYDHIRDNYPYWNRSAGRDHIWFFAWDEGACYAPKEIWNSIMLTHWGNTNSKHNHSTTAYFPDNWDHIPIEKRGTHPCFDPKKDLVLPAWKRPDPDALKARLWARSRRERPKLFYFNGNLGAAFENNRPEPNYSLGIRQKLAAEFSSAPNKEGKLGRQTVPIVTVVSERSPNYFSELASSRFCGVLPGDGWSGRMEDSILQGCIPVIIQDGIQLPYENVLNYDSFAVRIAEDDIPHLVRILKGINKKEVDFKLRNVKRLWQRFMYRDSVMLEARRQNASHGHMEDWAVQYSLLTQDDVMSTFLEVLHYKLHNDPWRSELSVHKEFGIPRSCQIQRNDEFDVNRN